MKGEEGKRHGRRKRWWPAAAEEMEGRARGRRRPDGWVPLASERERKRRGRAGREADGPIGPKGMVVSFFSYFFFS
jgi:hypothetical protein